MNYFDEPRAAPRYRGVSDPVNLQDQVRLGVARTQAIHRAYLDWAESDTRDHWVPGALVVEVADAVPEFFIRDKVAFVARMIGAPVLPMPPEMKR